MLAPKLHATREAGSQAVRVVVGLAVAGLGLTCQMLSPHRGACELSGAGAAVGAGPTVVCKQMLAQPMRTPPEACSNRAAFGAP
eukprot:4556658-Alexandrium_andersonii.AAC.1